MQSAMPILISFYAYRISYIWMKSGKEDSPTPLQWVINNFIERIRFWGTQRRYGLLIEALCASGFISLVNIGRYFIRSPRKRRPASYVLKEAFCVTTIACILVQIVGSVISSIRSSWSSLNYSFFAEHSISGYTSPPSPLRLTFSSRHWTIV